MSCTQSDLQAPAESRAVQDQALMAQAAHLLLQTGVSIGTPPQMISYRTAINGLDGMRLHISGQVTPDAEPLYVTMELRAGDQVVGTLDPSGRAWMDTNPHIVREAFSTIRQAALNDQVGPSSLYDILPLASRQSDSLSPEAGRWLLDKVNASPAHLWEQLRYHQLLDRVEEFLANEAEPVVLFSEEGDMTVRMRQRSPERGQGFLICLRDQHDQTPFKVITEDRCLVLASYWREDLRDPTADPTPVFVLAEQEPHYSGYKIHRVYSGDEAAPLVNAVTELVRKEAGRVASEFACWQHNPVEAALTQSGRWRATECAGGDSIEGEYSTLRVHIDRRQIGDLCGIPVIRSTGRVQPTANTLDRSVVNRVELSYGEVETIVHTLRADGALPSLMVSDGRGLQERLCATIASAIRERPEQWADSHDLLQPCRKWQTPEGLFVYVAHERVVIAARDYAASNGVDLETPEARTMHTLFQQPIPPSRYYRGEE